MRYVSTEDVTADTAARSLAGLRTSMGKDEVRFEFGWELQKEMRVSRLSLGVLLIFTAMDEIIYKYCYILNMC